VQAGAPAESGYTYQCCTRQISLARVYHVCAVLNHLICAETKEGFCCVHARAAPDSKETDIVDAELQERHLAFRGRVVLGAIDGTARHRLRAVRRAPYVCQNIAWSENCCWGDWDWQTHLDIVTVGLVGVGDEGDQPPSPAGVSTSKPWCVEVC
jgi:hypothetical protein